MNHKTCPYKKNENCKLTKEQCTLPSRLYKICSEYQEKEELKNE
jgi:hypothetical protein